MNLRISTGQLRFRITREELAALCTGLVLEQKTPLPGGRMLAVAIRADANSVPLHLDYYHDAMTLGVGKVSAQMLLDSLPNRQGLEAEQLIDGHPSLSLQLEVDIRSQKRDRAGKEHP